MSMLVDELKLLYPELSSFELENFAKTDEASKLSDENKTTGNFRLSQQISSSSDDDEAFENFVEKVKTPAPITNHVSPRSTRKLLKDFIVDDDDDPDSSNRSDSSISFYLSLEQRIKARMRTNGEREASELFSHNPATIVPFQKSSSIADHCSESDDRGDVEETDFPSEPVEREKTPDCILQFNSKKTPKTKTYSGRMKTFSSTPSAKKIENPEFSKIEQFLYTLSNKSTGNCFRKYRDKLVEELYCVFNRYVFNGKLPVSMAITWNVRLTHTAGFCHYSKNKPEEERTARIELSDKVCDNAERVRDTLVHEMCHAIVWILHGSRESHGPLWKYWASKAEQAFTRLPKITRCHHYEILGKFIYRCTLCNYEIHRHSKSLDIARKVCGKCHGKFELLRNGKGNSTATPSQTPKFALFVKTNYGSLKKSGAKLSHKEIMSSLGAMFKEQLKFVDEVDDSF